MDSLRRGSYRLKALGTGHKELQLVISEQKSSRVEFKNAIKVNRSATDQLVKWAQSEDSEALQVTVQSIGELNAAWCDVQRELAEQLKVANITFERILDEEKELDKARKTLEKNVQKEKSMQKEVDRIHKKGEDPGFAERKLEQAVRTREMSESEVQGQFQETEANKQNMVREGLMGVAQAHLIMARKCTALFEAYESICQTIPPRSAREADPPPFTEAASVAGMCQTAIRTMERAQVVRSASYPAGNGFEAAKRMSLPPSDPLPPGPDGYASPPSYAEVDSGMARSAPSLVKSSTSRGRPLQTSFSPDEGDWASDEFDD